MFCVFLAGICRAMVLNTSQSRNLFHQAIPAVHQQNMVGNPVGPPFMKHLRTTSVIISFEIVFKTQHNRTAQLGSSFQITSTRSMLPESFAML